MVNGAIILLFLLYFRTAIAWIFRLFTNAPFTGYRFVFILLVIATLAIVGYSFWKKWLKHIHFTYSKPTMVGLLVFLSADLLNTIFFHYQILSASAFLLGGYCLLGFYMDQKVWKRGIFLAILLTLTLPFIEHIQTFLGFPVRLMTAKIVSALMHGIGVSSVSDATVIMTENRANIIDVPCSGVKSLYTGLIFLCALYFFQQINFSVRMIAVSLIYFTSLLFFNVWRVFSLVYIYQVLQLTEVGDGLHVALGLGGFILSGLLAWVLTKRYLSPSPSTNQQIPLVEASFERKKPWWVIGILFCFLLTDAFFVLGWSRNSQIAPSSNRFVFQLEGVALQEIPFSQQEQGFFQNRDVVFTKKYSGKTLQGLPFTLLLVSSASWRTHHNPEICLQGMGYQIERSDVIQLPPLRVRKVTLGKNQGMVLYWFTDGDRTVNDYSERVWAGILHPNTVWTLVEIGFQEKVEASDPEILELIQNINKALRRL